MSTAIESVMHETRLFEPPQDFAAQANLTKADVDRMNAEAAADYPGFWGRLAKDNLLWHKPFSKVLDESRAPFYEWFSDGKLNVSHNCRSEERRVGKECRQRWGA